MQEEKKQQWINQTFANRVSISTNPGKLRIVVKAERFSLGNNMLTLTLSSLFISNALLAYLFVVGFITFGFITTTITLTSLVLTFGLTRAWLWHNLGEENIEINGDMLSVSRSYTLYDTKKKTIELGGLTDLFTNKVDTWNWRKMQNKGVFRVSDTTNSVDFGIRLNDEEYEMLVIPIGNKVKEYKVEKQSVVEEKVIPEEESIVEDANKPNLEEQQEGKHRQVLDDYYKKVAGTSEDLLDKIDPDSMPEKSKNGLADKQS
ncbi:MAG: hypothetical protein COB05_09270 [Marinobacter sp.]|nr:MAG: hypothetical protein COB05_09270 [Marinobacter sp.]